MCSCHGDLLLLLLYRGDQVHTSNLLLYHVMSMLKSNAGCQVFELVVDLTQATPYNEPDVSD